MRKKERKDKICQETRENLKGDKKNVREGSKEKERGSLARSQKIRREEVGPVCWTLVPLIH